MANINFEEFLAHPTSFNIGNAHAAILLKGASSGGWHSGSGAPNSIIQCY